MGHRLRLLSLVVTGALSACAGAPGATPTPIATRTAPPTVTATIASVTSTSTPVPPTAVATQVAATVAASPTPVLKVLSIAASQYQGLPQGITTDGFPFLGQPDAPLTLIDYSDFL
jgi:ABC-type Fe3+-hydroxamate transport system substrate-binding protein